MDRTVVNRTLRAVRWRNILTPRLVSAAILIGCLSAIAVAGKAGLSRYCAEEAVAYGDIKMARQAVRLESDDPQAYYSRGVVLLKSNQIDAATDDFDTATTLGPFDYDAWLHLGISYEASGTMKLAIGAYRESVRLAPYYAQPRWRLGNALLQNGQRDEGIKQLSLAAKSDPTLFPETIHKAWQAYNGNASEVERFIDPQTTITRMALVQFFIEQHEMPAALKLLHLVGKDADYLRYPLTIQLVEKARYLDASEVWRTKENRVEEGLINDGDFESGKLLDAAGFWWQKVRQNSATRITIDKEPGGRQSSLSLTFSGPTGPEFVKQLVLVKPQTSYQLTFDSRTVKLFSETLPTVIVTDAAPSGANLGTPRSITSGTSDWQTSTLEFQTTNYTNAIFISIQRPNCSVEPCQILGQALFDNFVLSNR